MNFNNDFESQMKHFNPLLDESINQENEKRTLANKETSTGKEEKEVTSQENNEKTTNTLLQTHTFTSSSLHFPFPIAFSSPISNTNAINLHHKTRYYDFQTFYYDNSYSKRQALNKQFLVEEETKIILNEPKDKILLKENEKKQAVTKQLKKQLDNHIATADIKTRSYFGYNNLKTALISKLMYANSFFNVLYSFSLLLFILGLIFLGLNSLNSVDIFFLQYDNVLAVIITGIVLSLIGLAYSLSVAGYVFYLTSHFGSLLFKTSYNKWLWKQIVPFVSIFATFSMLSYINSFTNTNSTYEFASKTNYLKDL